ncbi:MAG: hypothetical protein Q8P84_07480, partial [Deltaproteobacteria bacterium]|nr:hypothetical protein [Deltaproteobacteria bacterium]
KVGPKLYNLAMNVDRMKASPEMTIVHDPKWHVFPEIRRALKEMSASLEVFDLLEKGALADQEKHYKKDVWLDPHGRKGSVHITRNIMEELIQSGQAKREEFSPLDSYIEIIQLQKRLLKESRLSHSSRMAMGIFSSMLTDPWVQEQYAASLSLWMAKYDILAPIEKAVISDEAVRAWEDQLHRTYLRSRDNIATLEWAQKEIKKINPDWVKELEGLEGLKRESLPPVWHDNYEKFIFGLRDILAPYLARVGWIPLLEEWYFAAHAKFFRAGNSGSE